MAYYKSGKLELSRGNLKLGTDTIIFNFGSANECPSMARGLCKLGKKCYALKAERLYPGCKAYRDRQKDYWLNNDIGQICCDFENAINRMRVKPRYLRFNEAGDFWSQDCIDKLDTLAKHLKRKFNIVTYGYTARSDLDFSNVRHFNVKGSGHDNGHNGKTIARKKTAINGDTYQETDNEVFSVCPMDCRDCTLCKVRNNINIVFPLH